MERPEKLDLFMCCVFGTIANDKVRKILDEYISAKEIGDCVEYLASVAGRPTMRTDDMFDTTIAVLSKLKLELK